MLLSELTEPFLLTLDLGSGGLFSKLLRTFKEVHLTVQTSMEGLGPDEVKLYITIMHGDSMVDYAAARLDGAARVVGLQIYISDKLESAKAVITEILGENQVSTLLH